MLVVINYKKSGTCGYWGGGSWT